MKLQQIHLERAALFVLLVTAPLLASADVFDNSGYQMKTWLVKTFGGYASIGVIGFGIMALVGAVSGMMFVRILLFVGCVFGCDQLVALIKSFAGV